MILLFENVAKGFFLGLSLAVPPGPINATIAYKSLTSKRRGILIGLGALSADVIFMMTISLIKNLVSLHMLKLLSIIGSGYMIYLAISFLFFEQKNNRKHENLMREKLYLKMEYCTGLLLGLTNPFQVVWWLTAGISLVANIGYSMFVGFILGILLWITGLSIAINRGRSNKVFAELTRYFSSITLIAFAFYLIYEYFLNSKY